MLKGLSAKKIEDRVETESFQLNVTKTLIDELTKPRPNQKLIKELMSKIGLEYIHNDIDQLSKVLTYVSGIKVKSTKNPSQKELEL